MKSPTPLRAVNDQIDRLVEATPPERERLIDFLRAFSIVVVVLWHWSLSVTHRDGDGVLVMPNPLDAVPLGWLPTWLFQVMPVFFLVGGFVNLAGWTSTVEEGGGWREFYGRRARRLLAPVAVFLAMWTIFEAVSFLLVPDYRGVVVYADILLIPLWFIAAYIWVVALVPVTARLHQQGRELTVVTLGATVVLADLGRFQFGIDALGWLNTALVWVLVHQLGYFYQDGTFSAWPPRRKLALAIGALTGLVVLTSLEAYPRSMVAYEGAAISHLYPTTVGVAVLAVFQLAVVLLVGSALERWLQRDLPWKAVVAVNAVILTVFVWHMTAQLLAIGIYESLGFELGSEPTLLWWLERPLWIVFPGLFLVLLVAVFHPVEIRTGPRQSSS
jgi:peptidoglycan/LPS O-acetylase OafA/YrhL